MKLPPLVPVPNAQVRQSLGPAEWSACLDAWLTLCQLYLKLPAEALGSAATLENTVSTFLTTLFRESRFALPQDESLSAPKARDLQKVALRLTQRLVHDCHPCPAFVTSWDFLVDLAFVFFKTQAVHRLLEDVCQLKGPDVDLSVAAHKDSLTSKLESKAMLDIQEILSPIASLLRGAPQIAAKIMTGSDLVDALQSRYDRSQRDSDHKWIVSFFYLGLSALAYNETANISLLCDHLYTLKAAADGPSGKSTLLADLVTNTPLLSKLHELEKSSPSTRLQTLIQSLEAYRNQTSVRARAHPRKVAHSKGKDRATNHDFHIHRMSQVSQIQDLFPDLGSGFILKLLDEYNDNVEEATAHLLEDSLPPYLATADRTEQAPLPVSNESENVDRLVPRHTPPNVSAPSFVPQRRNVYDDDELDRMVHDTSRLHIGKRDTDDSITPDSSSKAAILSALAAFDSDDDERDDTYDVDDVGGTVDASNADHETTSDERRAAQHRDTTTTAIDAILFPVYQSNPELFARTTDTRRSQPRAALRQETNLTDEAIEGWAVMLQRDPPRQRRLELAASRAFDGRQTALPTTAYRGSETEDSDAAGGASRGAGGHRGRGRGGRGRGRGGRGAVDGASGDPGTAAAQRRKEANKSGRANHNRRDQRAKKMARGGFAG